MLKNMNRVIALALTGLLGVSGLPAPALAETVTISRAGTQASAGEVEAVSEATIGAAVETVSEATPRADVLVHRMDEPTWNADETFAGALARHLAGTASSAKEVGTPAARTIHRGGSTGDAAAHGAASSMEAESEAALNGLRIAVEGEGMGVRYRLLEADGWQEAWVADGAICSSEGAVSGLSIELTGDMAAGYDLWVSLRGSDGCSGAWGAWVLARKGEAIEVPDGTFITDVAVRLLQAPSAAPEPLGETTPAEEATALEEVMAVEEVPDTGTVAVRSMDAQVAPPADEVTESVEPGTALEDAAPEVDETEGGAAPVVQVAAEPVVIAAASEQPLEVPLVAAASDVSWARLFGETRYDTMSAISSTGFNASELAVVTTGQNFPDALSASGLAGALGCPILLTTVDTLSWQAASELERLGVTHVIIVGGVGAVSGVVQAELQDMGIECERVSGNDRMSTSVAVFDRLATATGSPVAAIVASGQSFTDALSISPYAYATNTPILLTDASGRLTDAELATLASSAVQEVIIVGGTSAVSEDVEGQLSYFSTRRLSGDDRYATSAKIAEFEQGAGLNWDVAYVCTGKTFPDALAGSALAGSGGSILVVADSLSHPTIELLRSHAQDMDHGVIFGGTNAFPFDDPLASEGGGQTQGEGQGQGQGQNTGKTGGKTGYQNPQGFYQVSSDNVTITSAATAPFDYITPSRIAADATREDCVAAFIGRAEEYIGTPYIWNYACAPGVGVDCIGLVYQCAYACGMDLGGGTGDSDFNPWAHYITGHSGWHSHDANNFWDYGLAMHVSLDARKPGDLISYPGHIAIYIGDDQIIHAYTPSTGVIYDDMWSPGTPRGCIRLFQ